MKKIIFDCLKSLTWTDETIVVDSDSSDKTVEIPKEFTDNVFMHKWQDYSAQKTYALTLVNNDQILSLYADERVSKNLAREILSTDLSDHKGYYIKRDNYFLGKHIRGCGCSNNMQLRLFKKSEAKLSNRLIHEKFIIIGKISKLNNTFSHYLYNNLNDAFNKINKCSTLDANEKVGKKSVNYLTMLLSPPFYFLHHFIIRKGFLDGIYGIIIS